MSNEPIKELITLGFSINEAKVYSYIIKQGRVIVKEISNATGIHSQDVYKVLSRLEKKGLILRAIGRPCFFEVVPIELGLKKLVYSIKNGIKREIKKVDESYTRLINTIQKLSQYKDVANCRISKTSHIFVIDKSKISKVDWTFKKSLKNQLYLVMPDMPFEWLDYVKEQMRTLKKRKVKIRILILIKKVDGKLADELANVMPKTLNFEIKILQYSTKLFFVIADDREAWIPIPSIGERVALVTDAPEIILILRKLFEKLWNDPKTKTHYCNSVV